MKTGGSTEPVLQQTKQYRNWHWYKYEERWSKRGLTEPVSRTLQGAKEGYCNNK